jgi:hypothetical protein
LIGIRQRAPILEQNIAMFFETSQNKRMECIPNNFNIDCITEVENWQIAPTPKTQTNP